MQIFCILLSKIFEPIYVIIFVILLSLFLLVKSKNKQAILLSTTALIAGASIYLLKHLFSKARPLNQIIQETGFSFPSGHAMISITLFGTLIYIALNIKSQTSRIVSIVACVLGVLLVGLSRVYLNVHWFSDIIGSYCFGLFILFIVLFGEKIWKQL
jgi:undecaprenyl-diphosphatase